MTTNQQLTTEILARWNARYADWRAGRNFSPSATDLAIDAADAFDGDHDPVDPLADYLYQLDEATGADLPALAMAAATFLTDHSTLTR